MKRILHSIFWGGLGVLIGLVILDTGSTTHAYPEYANRTGEQCTTCHVNPAGGGPRTLRGLLWIAEGKPDEVAALPGSSEEEGVELDGAALYQKYECARCHGITGEGDVGLPLNDGEMPRDTLIDVIVNGTGAMKGFGPDTISSEEMDVLVTYLQAMGRGEIQSAIFLQKRPLPPARLSCGNDLIESAAPNGCGGN